MKTEKKWILAPRIPEEIDRTLSGYPTPMRQILFNRGYATPEAAADYLAAESPSIFPVSAFRDAYGS